MLVYIRKFFHIICSFNKGKDGINPLYKCGQFMMSFYFIATPNHFIISLSSQPLRLA